MTMWKWLLVLSAFIVGCNSTDSENDSGALSGVYQHVMSGTQGDAVIQYQFNNDGTYNGKFFIYLDDGSANCLVSEGAGKWALAGGALKTTENKSRERDACEDPFPAWKDDPDDSEDVRNITATSFELFIEADDETPAQWLKFTKI